jgi:hypothetical protein
MSETLRTMTGLIAFQLPVIIYISVVIVASLSTKGRKS